MAEAHDLHDAARPGTVLVADLVRHLLGGRKALVLRPSHVDLAWEWTPDDAHGGIPLPPGLSKAVRGSHFVARVAERARLLAAWERARAGVQHMVAIGGEPGIGKTRLAAELARDAHTDGAVVLHGRADEDLAAPYKPFIEALTHHVRHVDPDDLRRQLGTEGRELFRLLPGLAERLPDLGLPTRSEPEAERFLLFEAMSAFMRRLSADAPIALVLDDLHWADKPTLRLLQHILRDPVRLLVVATYRDTEVGPRHPFNDVLTALRRDDVLDRVSLRAIDAADVAGFAAAFPDLDADDNFWARVHDQTGGNPFFIEEVLRHAADVGPDDARLPEGVSEIVARRLARLSDDTNRALAVAAVCGLEFDTATVETGTDLDENALLDALDEAAAAGVITEVSGTAGRWAFSHALVRRSMYEGLSAGRRARLHTRVGHALSGHHTPSAIEVANHLVAGVAAGDARRAVIACLEAADEARQLAGFEAVLVHADRALELIGESGLADLELEYQATMARADAAYGMADITTSIETYRRAAVLARQLDDAARFADAVIGYAGPVRIEPDADVVAFIEEALDAVGPAPSAQRVRLLGEKIDITVTWFGRGPLRVVLDEMVAAADQLDDAIAKAAAARAEGRFWQGSPNVEALRRAAAPAAELASVIDDRRYISARSLMASRIDLAYVAIVTGDRRNFDAALVEVDDHGRRNGLFFARWNVAVFRAAATIAEGRLDDALRGGQRSPRHSTRRHRRFPRYLPRPDDGHPDRRGCPRRPDPPTDRLRGPVPTGAGGAASGDAGRRAGPLGRARPRPTGTRRPCRGRFRRPARRLAATADAAVGRRDLRRAGRSPPRRAARTPRAALSRSPLDPGLCHDHRGHRRPLVGAAGRRAGPAR